MGQNLLSIPSLGEEPSINQQWLRVPFGWPGFWPRTPQFCRWPSRRGRRLRPDFVGISHDFQHHISEGYITDISDVTIKDIQIYRDIVDNFGCLILERKKTSHRAEVFSIASSKPARWMYVSNAIRLALSGTETRTSRPGTTFAARLPQLGHDPLTFRYQITQVYPSFINPSHSFWLYIVTQ